MVVLSLGGCLGFCVLDGVGVIWDLWCVWGFVGMGLGLVWVGGFGFGFGY